MIEPEPFQMNQYEFQIVALITSGAFLIASSLYCVIMILWGFSFLETVLNVTVTGILFDLILLVPLWIGVGMVVKGFYDFWNYQKFLTAIQPLPVQHDP